MDVVQLRKLVLLISCRLLLLLLHLLLHKGLQLLLLVSEVVLTRGLSTCVVGLVTILPSRLLTLVNLPWHHESSRVRGLLGRLLRLIVELLCCPLICGVRLNLFIGLMRRYLVVNHGVLLLLRVVAGKLLLLLATIC